MLAAFDAAARTGSFSGAARELHLSQGAISRQIKKLEEQLGVELFRRDRQAVSLTSVGATYAIDIHQALNTIRAASLSVMTDPLGGAMNLAILPTFGTRWLIPRLPSFLSDNPRITINFVMKLSPFDFADEGLDAAIHYGAPDWPDANCTFLLDEEVVPVCSPAFLAEHGIKDPESLLSAPLLHISTRAEAWQDWFGHNELDTEPPHGMHFEQFSSAAQAAVAGLGVALMPVFLIKAELDRNLLVPAIDHPTKSASAYYLATPNTKSENPSVSALRDWLLDEIKTYNQR